MWEGFGPPDAVARFAFSFEPSQGLGQLPTLR